MRHIAVRGFGLIELMISLVIASVLVLGLMAVVGNTQASFSAQTDMAAIADKERFAEELFSSAVQSAGYYTISLPLPTNLGFKPGGSQMTAFPAYPAGLTGGLSYLPQQTIFGINGVSSDTLNVRFQSSATDPNSPNIQNCLGATANGVAGVYESVFSVDTVNNNLICQTDFNGGTLSAATVLIDGITSMSVRFGVDGVTGGGGPDFSAQEYMTATTLQGKPVDWPLVRSVQVTLNFAAATDNNLTAPIPYTLTIPVMYGDYQ